MGKIWKNYVGLHRNIFNFYKNYYIDNSLKSFGAVVTADGEFNMEKLRRTSQKFSHFYDVAYHSATSSYCAV